VKSKKETFRHL